MIETLFNSEDAYEIDIPLIRGDGDILAREPTV